ncbi:hypothetical protein [Variovorax sp. RCC_210]|uniref:hypothetical protein n=1 Tax=Variovorax sp. RCC_210 TaxID=3239217 RepID=UPI0035249363
MFDGPWGTCMLVRGLNPSECASWVQAWGSIGAILAAVMVAFVQHRQNLRQQRLVAELARRQAIAAHVARGEAMSSELAAATPLAVSPATAEWVSVLGHTQRVMTELGVFDSLPVNSLPDGEAINAVRQISRHVAEWNGALQYAYAARSAGHDLAEVRHQFEMKIAEASEQLRRELQILKSSALDPD